MCCIAGQGQLPLKDEALACTQVSGAEQKASCSTLSLLFPLHCRCRQGTTQLSAQMPGRSQGVPHPHNCRQGVQQLRDVQEQQHLRCPRRMCMKTALASVSTRE